MNELISWDGQDSVPQGKALEPHNNWTCAVTE